MTTEQTPESQQQKKEVIFERPTLVWVPGDTIYVIGVGVYGYIQTYKLVWSDVAETITPILLSEGQKV